MLNSEEALMMDRKSNDSRDRNRVVTNSEMIVETPQTNTRVDGMFSDSELAIIPGGINMQT